MTTGITPLDLIKQAISRQSASTASEKRFTLKEAFPIFVAAAELVINEKAASASPSVVSEEVQQAAKMFRDLKG